MQILPMISFNYDYCKVLKSSSEFVFGPPGGFGGFGGAAVLVREANNFALFCLSINTGASSVIIRVTDILIPFNIRDI